MPLPVNGSLLLQGHSRPGETLHSRPKQAIIVRMSEETLEALEASPQHPQMDFEFGQNGENAGIYIGDTYFPMRPLAEGSTHDLYLRATSASRPMAPLKLYAHVTGKLAVERELGGRIQDRIRESTKDAVKQRSERTTILLDNPPEISHPKKRGAAPPARKHPRPSDYIRNAAQPATSTLVARVGSPAPSLTKSGGASVPVRKRLIQCLAVSEKSPDEVVRLIGGAGCDPSTRRDLLGLLDEVAEPVPGAKKTSSQPWRLKNTAWLDVRPYEWQKLTETQRSNMSVAARRAFTSFGLPANHPAWERLSRPSGTGITDPYTPSPAGPSKIASAAVVAPKRGLSSREVKDKKAKPKTDSKEIMMKDESVRMPSRLSNANGPADGGDSRSSSAAAKVAPRKPPGSGFRAGRASPSEFGSSAADDPARTRGKPTDVRVKDRGPPAPSQPARSAPPIPPPAMQEKRPAAPAVPQRIKKRNGDRLSSDKESPRDREIGREKERRERERDREVAREREPLRGGEKGRETPRERERDRETPRERERAGEAQHERTRERETLREQRDRDSEREAVRNRGGEPKRRGQDAPSLKRKKPVEEDDDYEDNISRTKTMKKRRSDEPAKRTSTTSLKESSNAVEPVKRPDSTIPPRPKTLKKEPSPLPPPLPKINKDPSPMPRAQPPITKVASGSSTSSSTLQASYPSQSHSVSSKSSKPNHATSKGRRRSPIYTSSEDEGEIRRPSRRDGASAPYANTHTRVRSLPTDHAALRARYNTSYLEYLSTFQKLVVQKGKLDTLLKNHSGSVGSITDSDGDVDLMDSDELAQLGSDHRRLREELQTIQQLFKGDSICD